MKGVGEAAGIRIDVTLGGREKPLSQVIVKGMEGKSRELAVRWRAESLSGGRGGGGLAFWFLL